MCKFVATREDLGNRLVGFTLYESRSKEFIGMTEKAIITAMKNWTDVNKVDRKKCERIKNLS